MQNLVLDLQTLEVETFAPSDDTQSFDNEATWVSEAAVCTYCC